jgi:hypothetical protein
MWHSQYLFFSGDESLLGVVVLSEEVAAEDDRANVLASFDKLTLLDSLVPRGWPVLTLSMQRRMTRGSSMWLLAARYAGISMTWHPDLVENDYTDQLERHLVTTYDVRSSTRGLI